MKKLFAGVLLSVLCAHGGAKPSAAVVDACLRTASESVRVHYTPIEVDAFQVTEDEEARKTITLLRYETDTVGTWEVKKPQAFGLVFNGKETPLARVTRLDRHKTPVAFNPYEAIWGKAREGGKSYICATFNFEGLGKSGSFQKLRGLYLIERGRGAAAPFYTAGIVAASEK